MKWRGYQGLTAALVCAALAGCAAGEASQPGPSTTGSLAGSRCNDLKAEASRLEARGVQYKADQAGRDEIKLSPQQKADVARYNAVLDQYLGGKCHL